MAKKKLEVNLKLDAPTYIIRSEVEKAVKPRAFLNPLPRNKKRQIQRLGDLDLGDRFEIVSLEEVYKNLYLAATSDCTSRIVGQVESIYDKGVFLPLSNANTVSSNTQVREV